MAAGEVTEEVYISLNSWWSCGESQPNQLNFDDIVNEVTLPSGRTGKVSEHKRAELFMWSYFRLLTSVGGKCDVV